MKRITKIETVKLKKLIAENKRMKVIMRAYGIDKDRLTERLMENLDSKPVRGTGDAKLARVVVQRAKKFFGGRVTMKQAPYIPSKKTVIEEAARENLKEFKRMDKGTNVNKLTKKRTLDEALADDLSKIGSESGMTSTVEVEDNN